MSWVAQGKNNLQENLKSLKTREVNRKRREEGSHKREEMKRGFQSWETEGCEPKGRG